MNFNTLEIEKIRNYIDIELFEAVIDMGGFWKKLTLENTDFIVGSYDSKNHFLNTLESYVFIYPIEDNLPNDLVHNILDKYKMKIITILGFNTPVIYLYLLNINYEINKDLFKYKDLYLYLITKSLRGKEVDQTTLTQNIKYNDDSYFGEVVECLKTAHLKGLDKNIKSKINQKLFLERVESHYKTIEFDFLIYENDLNEFCGHIAWIKYENKAYIIDSYVLEPYQGKGISKLLTSSCENILKSQKIIEIESTIIATNNTEIINEIFNDLNKEQWKLEAIVYSFKNQID